MKSKEREIENVCKNQGNQVRERDEAVKTEEEMKEKQRQNTASKQANHDESVRSGGVRTKRSAPTVARARVRTGGCTMSSLRGTGGKS